MDNTFCMEEVYVVRMKPYLTCYYLVRTIRCTGTRVVVPRTETLLRKFEWIRMVGLNWIGIGLGMRVVVGMTALSLSGGERT